VTLRKLIIRNKDKSQWATHRRELLALTLLLLFGYALRTYAVAELAFRGDEAFGIGLATMPVRAMLALMTSSEPSPPLHPLLLKVWMPLAGSSELAVRWPSVLGGTLSLALMYRLGRAWVGPSPSRWAVLLAAVNPFLIWSSQDARVYPLLLCLVLSAVWHLWQAAHSAHALRHWLAAGVLWWLALFTHYFAIFPLAAVGLALWLAPQTRVRWRQAVKFAIGLGLAYLPWAVYVGSSLSKQTKDWPTGNAAWRFLTAFSVGTTEMGALVWVQLIGGGLLTMLLIIGAVAAFRREPTAAIWGLSLALGTPFFFWMLTLLKPTFLERYAISALPAVLMIAACGAHTLSQQKNWSRWLSRSVMIGLALAALLSLQNYFFDPAYAKSSKWREITQYLADTARAKEVVVLNLPDPAFYLYYRGPMLVEASPPNDIVHADPPATEAQLRYLRDQFHHIRFFFSPNPGYDPEGYVGNWLEACCEKLADEWVHGFRIQTFDTPTGSLAARQPYAVEFEKGIHLTGYRVVNPVVHAGETVHLTLYWTARRPIQASYTVFVHFLAPDGFDLVDADSLPDEGRKPTNQWQVGEPVIDPHPIPVPIDLSPGDYRIEIGLYLLETGERLSVVDVTGQPTDHVLLPVTIKVPPP
jgi:hypothetical protein